MKKCWKASPSTHLHSLNTTDLSHPRQGSIVTIQVQSPKSKVKSQKLKGLGVTLFCCCTTIHKRFSQQPDILLSSNFHSRLTWPRLNDFSFKILFRIQDCDKVESNSSLDFYIEIILVNVSHLILGVTPLLSSLGGHCSVVKINLVAQHNKWEVIWVPWTSLGIKYFWTRY